MKIGLLGGSFNPPHIGHILVASQVLDFAGFDEVWFVPAYKHSFDKPLAPFDDRLAMVKQILIPKTRVVTFEKDFNLDGNTINLLPILAEKYPNHDFTFIIGSDQLPTFHKWGDWKKLLEQMKFLVVERAGYPIEPLYKGMQLLKNELFVTTNMSSSMVRARIKKSLPIDHFLDSKTQKYIQINKLYTFR